MSPESQYEVPPELEASFQSLLDRPTSDHEAAVAALCARHPEHAAMLWRWLAVVRGMTQDTDRPALPAVLLGQPERLGPYRLLERIGQGGMGAVFRAVHEPLGREVALKMIRLDICEDATARARFRREVQALSRIEHPNICRVYESGEDRGLLYMSMQLIRGEDLAQRIRIAQAAHGTCVTGLGGDGDGSPRADLLAIARLFETLARAVHSVHELGLLHRDLKPANIVVTPQGEPVVLDFGVVRDTSAATGATLGGTASPIGTIDYMAPEQVAGGATPLDRRCDVFALGASLYECLSLQRPFQAASQAETLQRLRREDPPPLHRINRRVPRDLSHIVARALEKSPERRYQDAAALADDLRRLLAHEPVMARAIGPGRRMARWVRRNPAASLVLAVVGVAAGVSIALDLGRKRALADFELLAHGVRLTELREASRTLHPPWPEQVEPMTRWLLAAGQLTDSLPELERSLASLVERIGSQPASRMALPVVAAPEANLRDRFLRDTLTGLVQQLRAFADPEHGEVARVGRDLQWARSVTAPSIDGPRAAWDQALAAIRGDPRYGGVALVAQLGLVPLGPDPTSGLWEFADLRSGTAPVRGADGALVRDEATGLVFVLIPGGRFRMGAQATDPHEPAYDPLAARHEWPPHEVELAPFFLSKFELTQAQWMRLTHEENPSYYRAGPDWKHFGVRATNPVESVTAQHGEEVLVHHGMALPTEAQWEYSCRAGTESPWWTGAEPESLATGRHPAENLADRSVARAGYAWPEAEECPELRDGFAVPAPVGTFRPNPFGLYDMHGNVHEWCRERYVLYAVVPPGPGDGHRPGGSDAYRTIRGGSMQRGPRNGRTTARTVQPEVARDSGIGLRPARAVFPH